MTSMAAYPDAKRPTAIPASHRHPLHPLVRDSVPAEEVRADVIVVAGEAGFRALKSSSVEGLEGGACLEGVCSDETEVTCDGDGPCMVGLCLPGEGCVQKKVENGAVFDLKPRVVRAGHVAIRLCVQGDVAGQGCWVHG